MFRIKYKLILLGNSGVGKTSFARKLCNYELKDNNISSIGIDKISLDMEIDIEKNGVKEKKSFEISLFDTVGQEKFRSIATSYYKGSDGIILIYDVTDKRTFETVEMWIDSIKEAIDEKSETNYVIFLLGNKIDLIDDYLKEREVKEEEAIKVCEKYNLFWGGELSIKKLEKNRLNIILSEFVKELYKNIGENENPKQKIKSIKGQEKKKLQVAFFNN